SVTLWKLHDVPTRRSSDLGAASSAASGVSRGAKALPGVARNFANKAAGGLGAAQGVGNKIAQQGLGKTMSSGATPKPPAALFARSEEHTSELQSRFDLV